MLRLVSRFAVRLYYTPDKWLLRGMEDRLECGASDWSEPGYGYTNWTDCQAVQSPYWSSYTHSRFAFPHYEDSGLQFEVSDCSVVRNISFIVIAGHASGL